MSANMQLLKQVVRTSFDPAHPPAHPPASRPSASPAPTQLSTSEKLSLWEEATQQVAATTHEPDVVSTSVPVESGSETVPTAMEPPPPVSDQARQAASLATASLKPPPPSVFDQVLPKAIDEATDTLNPAQVSTSPRKEVAAEGASSSSAAPIEAGPLQAVESEKQPELPVEVEGYLQQVDDHQDDIVHEVVIADGSTEDAQLNYPSQPVIVLPIDEAMEKKARFKGPKYSIRWLVEWSHKIIKMFAGKVVYRSKE